MSDAPNLQRRVYDVAVAATECYPILPPPTQAHSVVEAVIKCRCMEAPLCGERISSGSLGTQGNSQLSLLPHKDKDGTTSVRIMKLTDLTSYATLAVTAAVSPTSLVVPRLESGNHQWRRRRRDVAAEAKIVIGGPRTHGGWGGNAGSI